MKAYKGFTKDMKCRGFQFKEGKTYEEKTASLCNSGFHACENPLDCMSYYAPNDSVYRTVDLEGVSEEHQDDSKICAKRITVGARISIVDGESIKPDTYYMLKNGEFVEIENDE